LLRLLSRHLVAPPAGWTIEEFMFQRGKLPEWVAAAVAGVPGKLTLAELRESYLRSQEKKLERTTLDGSRLHFDHLARILGGKAVVRQLVRADLQAYADARSAEWIDPEVYRRRRRAKAAAAGPKRKYTRRNAAPKAEEPPPVPPGRPRKDRAARPLRKAKPGSGTR
jgi:hypothetical protein